MCVPDSIASSKPAKSWLTACSGPGTTFCGSRRRASGNRGRPRVRWFASPGTGAMGRDAPEYLEWAGRLYSGPFLSPTPPPPQAATGRRCGGARVRIAMAFRTRARQPCGFRLLWRHQPKHGRVCRNSHQIPVPVTTGEIRSTSPVPPRLVASTGPRQPRTAENGGFLVSETLSHG